MSWCNALRRTGSDFCATDNFQGTFAHFCVVTFTQKRIIKYVHPYPQNLQLQGVGVFQKPLSMCLVIVEK